MLSEDLVSVALHHIGGQVLSIFVYYKAFLTFNMATCMTTDSDSQGFIVDTQGEYLPVQLVPTQTRKQPRLPKSHYGTTFVHLHMPQTSVLEVPVISDVSMQGAWFL